MLNCVKKTHTVLQTKAEAFFGVTEQNNSINLLESLLSINSIIDALFSAHFVETYTFVKPKQKKIWSKADLCGFFVMRVAIIEFLK